MAANWALTPWRRAGSWPKGQTRSFQSWSPADNEEQERDGQRENPTREVAASSVRAKSNADEKGDEPEKLQEASERLCER